MPPPRLIAYTGSVTREDREWYWEEGFRREKATLLSRTVPDLLTRVAQRRLGDHYAICEAIAEKAALADAGWPLVGILRSNLSPAHRMMCAHALLKLLPGSGLFPVDIGGDRPVQHLNIAEVEDKLRRRIGRPPE